MISQQLICTRGFLVIRLVKISVNTSRPSGNARVYIYVNRFGINFVLLKSR